MSVCRIYSTSTGVFVKQNLIGPIALSREYVVKDFDCGEKSLNEWLKRRAWKNEGQSSRTYVVIDNTQAVVAYYAMCSSSIEKTLATVDVANKQPNKIPAQLLGRLAVSLNHQNQGIGPALVKDFIVRSIKISESTAVRVLLVDALNERAKELYLKFDFLESPMDPLYLMLKLDHAKEFLAGWSRELTDD